MKWCVQSAMDTHKYYNGIKLEYLFLCLGKYFVSDPAYLLKPFHNITTTVIEV